MGFRFRKSFKIAPGVRVNIGKRGVSSVSVGRRGARVNVSKKGVRTSVGIPGTGLGYSSSVSGGARRATSTSGAASQASDAGAGSSLLGCLAFVIGTLFFGGCIMGACRACILGDNDKKAPREHATVAVPTSPVAPDAAAVPVFDVNDLPAAPMKR